ncbi:MAG: FtsX-like permease family protein [Pseudomonadota bacterium]
MSALWSDIPNGVQSGFIFALLITPAILLTFVLLRGHQPLKLSFALVRAHRATVFGFIALIAISVAVGIGLIAQERSLRIGAATAAEKFDIVIGAPGSETNLLFSTVFLQPNPLPLLDGEIVNQIYAHERTALAAPMAVGDSYEGASVIGTTAEFLDHLGGLAEGRMWTNSLEAIAGIDAPVNVGQVFDPAHGHGADADALAHEGLSLEVTGQLARTYSPWDQAIFVPVESVWETHGLANGHAPEDANQLGSPFDARYFPGATAVIVVADSFSGTFQIHSDFNAEPATMAILPGAVLGYLYRVLGDIRGVATVLTWLSLGLVALAVLGGLAILARLFTRHLAVLRAIGAPLRFVTATIWGFCALAILAGSVLGTLGAFGMVALIGQVISARTGISLPTSLGWSEFQLLAGFLSLSLLIAWFAAWRMAEKADPQILRS